MKDVNESGLYARRVQVAGSASARTEPALIQYAHSLVSQTVRGILEAGGGLVLGVGKEPLLEDRRTSLVFDWTILETVGECCRSGTVRWPMEAGVPLVVTISEKSASEIPAGRQALWQELLHSGKLRAESIMPGARSAALMREKQVQFGDILLTLGGGTGVEHLAQLYQARRRHVIPLDLPLGASREDGLGGSLLLSRQAQSEPQRFFSLRQPLADFANTRLSTIATQKGNVSVEQVAVNLLDLLQNLSPPRVFYTRLLNPQAEDYAAVESYFRNVVDPVVEELGFIRIEMGTDPSNHAFINVAIFDDLHHASVVVADFTGLRPNCFTEFGYALGCGARVIPIAKEGTVLPFDQSAMPHHFWKPEQNDLQQREELLKFWRNNINRPPLVVG